MSVLCLRTYLILSFRRAYMELVNLDNTCTSSDPVGCAREYTMSTTAAPSVGKPINPLLARYLTALTKNPLRTKALTTGL